MALTEQQRATAEAHVRVARNVARSAARRCPPWAADAVESAAMLGLVRAAMEHDPARGAPFRAFAVMKIRNAIVEDLRSSGPRGYQSRRWRRAGVPSVLNGGGYQGEPVGREAVPDPARGVDDADEVRHRLGRLKPRDSAVVWAVCGEGKTFTETAGAFGLSQPRVSQIVAKSLELMRS